MTIASEAGARHCAHGISQRRGHLFWAAALFFSLTAHDASATIPPEARDDARVQVQTKHFSVISNLTDYEAGRVGRDLERPVEVLANTHPALRSLSPLPTRVFAFHDRPPAPAHQ